MSFTFFSVFSFNFFVINLALLAAFYPAFTYCHSTISWLLLKQLPKEIVNIIEFVSEKEKSIISLYKVAILYFQYILGKKLEKSCYSGFLSLCGVVIRTIARLNMEETNRFINN